MTPISAVLLQSPLKLREARNGDEIQALLRRCFANKNEEEQRFRSRFKGGAA